MSGRKTIMNPDKIKLGIAPIGWTNDDMPDLGAENTFEQCVSEMALAGYAGCEIGNKYPQDRVTLKHALDVRDLTVCNAWFSSLLLSQPYAATIEAFRAHAEKLRFLGARIIGVSEQGNSIQGRLDRPILDDKPVYSEEQWDLVVRGFNEMGRIARDLGMFLTVHHHMGTGVQTGAEIDRLMAATDPELVWLLFDTGHLAFAGVDLMEILSRYGSRIRHVHLKDLRRNVFQRVAAEKMSFLDAVRAGVFTVPGDGDLDFAPVFAALDRLDYTGWMVVEAEQDPARANPFEYAVMARTFIRQTTGL